MGQGALEIVHDGQHLDNGVAPGGTAKLLAVALAAAPDVDQLLLRAL